MPSDRSSYQFPCNHVYSQHVGFSLYPYSWPRLYNVISIYRTFSIWRADHDISQLSEIRKSKRIRLAICPVHSLTISLILSLCNFLISFFQTLYYIFIPRWARSTGLKFNRSWKRILPISFSYYSSQVLYRINNHAPVVPMMLSSYELWRHLSNMKKCKMHMEFSV